MNFFSISFGNTVGAKKWVLLHFSTDFRACFRDTASGTTPHCLMEESILPSKTRAVPQ